MRPFNGLGGGNVGNGPPFQMSPDAFGKVSRLRLGVGAVGAVVAVALAAFFYHYITHIPAARPQRAQEAISVSVDRELQLGGLGPGLVMRLAVRDAEGIELLFEGGTTLSDPPPSRLLASPIPAGQAVSTQTGGRRRVTISPPPGRLPIISLEVEGDRPSLLFAPALQVGRAKGFRVWPRRGTLRIHAELYGGEDSDAGLFTYADGQTVRLVDRLEVAVPIGGQLSFYVRGLGIHAAEAHAEDGAVPLVITLPVADPNRPEQPRLAVGSVAVGHSENERFTVDSIFCAAEPGRTALWRSPLPAIELDRCVQGGLQVTRFDPLAEANQIYVADGLAFRTKDGATDYWSGPSGFLGNSVISAVFGALVLSLVAWAGLRTRRLLAPTPEQAKPKDSTRNGQKRARGRRR